MMVSKWFFKFGYLLGGAACPEGYKKATELFRKFENDV